MQNFLLQQAFLNSNLELFWASESIAHCRQAYIQGQADHELTVGGVATTLDDILRLNFEGCWIVDLLEVTGEVALVIILPLDQATDLVCKLGITDVATSLIHCSLVTALECRCFDVIP